MFSSNDYVINLETQNTKIFIKNINAKSMDSVQIISINNNLVKTIFDFFKAFINSNAELPSKSP